MSSAFMMHSELVISCTVRCGDSHRLRMRPHLSHTHPCSLHSYVLTNHCLYLCLRAYRSKYAYSSNVTRFWTQVPGPSRCHALDQKALPLALCGWPRARPRRLCCHPFDCQRYVSCICLALVCLLCVLCSGVFCAMLATLSSLTVRINCCQLSDFYRVCFFRPIADLTRIDEDRATSVYHSRAAIMEKKLKETGHYH